MKKIRDIVKRFNFLVLSLIILLFSFNFSFANNLNNLTFDNQPLPTNSNNALVIGSTPYIYSIYQSSGTTPVYIFGYGTSGSRKVAVCSLGSGCAVTLVENNTTYQLNQFSSTTYGFYANDNIFTLPLENCLFPVYSTKQEGYNAVQYRIDNPPIINKYPYTFQNGYLFVYDLGQSGAMYSFDLISKSEEYSNIGDNPFPNTNQSYWFENSLPETDETTIPSSSAITIQWLKGDKTNIFGQTQDMKATISGTSTGRYLYIYNPPAHYKWSGSSNPSASETINYSVTINGVSSGDNFYIYDSRALLFDYNQGGKVQGTVTGETGYGSVSTDGAISVVTSEGAIYNQNSGGSTDISGANGGSIAENINGLKETLDNFVNQFIQLLSAPISHIQQLIQSSHEFFDVFSQLFEWLPSDLSSVIVSGLIIMVVIGVIKMLL